MRRSALLAGVLLLATLIALTVVVHPGGDAEDRQTASHRQEPPTGHAASGGYLARACRLPSKWLLRIDRGWDPGPQRESDLILVPKPPNYVGTLIDTSHSGPYGFLQHVPLVLRGPGHIRRLGRVELERDVTVADLAPTLARLMHFDWEERAGSALDEILVEPAPAPKLIISFSIDGGGWNVLEQWPGSWPNLRRVIDEGVNVQGATAGSSPSITPAIHTTMSTGAFPRRHGITGIAIRRRDGGIVGAFSRSDSYPGPKVDPDLNLRLTTIGDDWDRATGNAALVGLVTSGNYALGMLGHGADVRGGDRDLAAMLGTARTGTWRTDRDLYYVPDFFNELRGADREVAEVDRQDGRVDNSWMGHRLDETEVGGTPAVALYEARLVSTLISREGFGRDAVTDLLFVHFKSPDHVGHLWNMISAEMREVLASVDSAIARVLAQLDATLGADNYVATITADHGQTPLQAGGWPISRTELLDDIQSRFDRTANGNGIVEQTSAAALFLDREEMRGSGTSARDVARYLNTYTIGDNIQQGDAPPKDFRARTSEPIFEVVFPGRALPRVLRCAGLG